MARQRKRVAEERARITKQEADQKAYNDMIYRGIKPVPPAQLDKKLYPDAAPGGYGISQKQRESLARDRFKNIGADTPNINEPTWKGNPPANPPAPPEPPVGDGIDLNKGQRGVARLDPNAKDLEGVMYRSNFIKGQENMPAMEEYFGSLNTPGLDEWAKANPALAYKEYKKSGQPDISITEIDNDPMSMANQFKNNYMTEITELLSNEDFNPYPELGDVAKKIGFDLNLDPDLMEKMRKRYTEGFGLF